MAREAELARKFLDRGMKVPDARSKLPAVRKLLLEVYKLGAGIGLDLKNNKYNDNLDFQQRKLWRIN